MSGASREPTNERFVDQHFTTDMAAIDRVLATLPLVGRRILEVGAGKGALTAALLAREPAKVLAFEIEPGLCALRDPRLDLREVAFDSEAAKALAWDCIVAIPPYSLLPTILALLAARPDVDALLMVPGKYTRAPLLPSDFRVVADVPNEAFSPPSTGTHHLLQRGFR